MINTEKSIRERNKSASKLTLQEQLVAIPPGPFVTCVRYDSREFHILRIQDAFKNEYVIAVPLSERIGCHGTGEHTGCTLCSTCQFEPDDDSCKYIMKNSRMTPLYKGMCGY